MRLITNAAIMATLFAAPIFAQSPAPPAAANCHTTLFGGTVCAQQPAPAQTPSNTGVANDGCRLGSTAAARLMCADPDLGKFDSMLAKVYRDAKQRTSAQDQKVLVTGQLKWIRERNEKCGLVGKDNAPIDELRSAKSCIEGEIKARIAALQIGASDNPERGNSCQTAKTATVRLICSDPDLAEAELAVARAYDDARLRASPANQKTMEEQQEAWLQRRNEKCGLVGMDSAPVGELRAAKQCMQEEIKARFTALRDPPQSNPAPLATASAGESTAPTSQGVSLDPIIATSASATSSPQAPGAFQQFRFSFPGDGLTGTVACSAPAIYEGSDPFANTPFAGRSIIKIAVTDDASSYRLFEGDTWISPLGQLRHVAKSACADAATSGRLRDANEKLINNIYDAFEVYSPHGLFMAYSVGQNARWIVQTNLPKKRNKIQADLGIQKWVDPVQLARNPYFFRDIVVGLLAQFDRKLSATEAVFRRDGVEIYFDGIDSLNLGETQVVVLAGRVRGNKGIIERSGDEVLMPALDYIGQFKCDGMCAALGRLPIPEVQALPMTQVEK